MSNIPRSLARMVYCIGVACVLEGVFTIAGCNYASIDDTSVVSTTPEKVSPYQLVLRSEFSDFFERRDFVQQNGYLQKLAFHPSQTWLSLSYAPVETLEILPMEIEEEGSDRAAKVKPAPTPWAAAYDREMVVLKMNDILLSNGIESESMRVRMIAHAIVASGWKQKVWNFNAWGVRQGSWDNNWYVMPTYEEDENGQLLYVADASWRAFSNWEEAVRDFRQRISPDSERPSYREAYRYLSSELISARVAKAYWEALSEGNYYTASWFTGDKFARLCGGVRTILNAYKPA